MGLLRRFRIGTVWRHNLRVAVASCCRVDGCCPRARVAGLLLNKPQILLAVVEPDQACGTKHTWMQVLDFGAFAYPPDFVVETHITEPRTAFA